MSLHDITCKVNAVAKRYDETIVPDERPARGDAMRTAEQEASWTS